MEPVSYNISGRESKFVLGIIFSVQSTPLKVISNGSLIILFYYEVPELKQVIVVEESVVGV